MKLEDIKAQATPYYHKAKIFTYQNLIKKYFIIGIVAWLLLGWRIQSRGSSTTTSVSEYTVTTGDIQNTIDAYGSINLVDEQAIRFNQQGNVTAVYFKKWDQVKKGDIIAELDPSSVQSDILQAELSLENAKLQLDETVNGDRSAQILQAQNNLDQTKAKLDIAQQQYDNLVTDLSGSGPISDRETTLENIKLDIQDYITAGEKTINELDTIFWVSDDYKQYNDSFEIYLSAKNPSFKTATDASIESSYTRLASLKNYYSSRSSDSGTDTEELLQWLDLTKNLYDAIYAASVNAYSALQNSIANIALPQSTIDWYVSQVSSDSSKAKSTLSSILTSKNQINNLSSSNNKITLETQSAAVDNLQNEVTIDQKALETAQNGTTEQQLQISENNIEQKQLALDQTKKNLEDLQIIAPFDGTLRKIDFKVGDKVTSSDEKYVYLENPNLVEVSISLDQIDVVNVRPGMPVQVVLDSYPGVTFDWVLGDIDSTPTTTNGVVSYTVKVTIDKWAFIMYSGMTASVKIIVEDKQDILVIPTTYIQSQAGTKFVLDKNSKQIEIQAGITDGTQTEIVSWLTEGMTIEKVTTKSTSSSSSASSSFRLPGVGGGWGGGGWLWWGGGSYRWAGS